MLNIILLSLTITASIDANAAPSSHTQSNQAQSNQTQMQAATTSVWEPPAGLQQIPIWPGAAPNMTAVHPRKEWMQVITPPEVKPGRTYTQVLDVTKPTMTIFPPKGVNTGASMVVFPGGGFRNLAIDLEGTEICDWVTSKGITCVLLKYRVPKSNHYWDSDCNCAITPKVPFALQDAQRTIRLLRAKAKEFDIDPNKIGVIGFSAGGYLVAQTSNIFKSTYQHVDAADKQSSRPDFAVTLYPGHICRYKKTFDAALKVTDQTPPTFLLQAWDDPIDHICNSTMYAKALSDAGVPSEVHLFAKGGHAFGLRSNDHPIASWPTLLENWLKEMAILSTFAAH